ncbi:B3/4 domain-containing protein [Promethearchaeum syntrophicum]|uniref:B3/4 domain-containing protein n=1 Tax=Promethearchaeum syntrophicum TaxID=2594042 RepID=A0A5B9DD64_9ARCH|nr:phenylalanine--tRNA ligase beta subunit-related protein [Candidatus Prometheoarchaeum syntrophicum]QEE16656.1 phenylalanyl-tRNA synthetase subunit beta [Candidatus Prometheoarchaeum syntrophicum]
MIQISFSNNLQKNDIQISIATMEISDFKIISDKYDFDQIILKIKSDLKSKYTIENIKDDQIVSKYRKFYWNHLHLDPTKIRPSSEALIRRILKNQRIPKISAFVDAYNWASAAALIPMGAYDIETFDYPIVFRLTQKNETFIPIGMDVKNLPPNTLVISDKKDTILSQYPYRDSKFSMVTRNSKNIILIACGVPGISKDQLFFALARTKKHLEFLRNKKVINFKLSEFEYFSLA